MGNSIPEKISGYNVYDDAEQLIGISAEVTLPTFESNSEEVSGAGILGAYESPTLGHFGSQTIEIPFRTLIKKSFSLLKYSGRSLVLRAAQQSLDVSAGKITQRGLKITIKYLPKSLELGKLSVGTGTETKNTLEIIYIKIEEDGKKLLELDKINYVYIVDGEDMLSAIKKLI